MEVKMKICGSCPSTKAYISRILFVSWLGDLGVKGIISPEHAQHAGILEPASAFNAEKASSSPVAPL
jgi:hypothetical protein